MCRPKAQPALEGVTVAIIAVRCCIGIVSTGVVLCLFWFELIMSRTPRGVVCLYTILYCMYFTISQQFRFTVFPGGWCCHLFTTFYVLVQ